MSNHTGRVILSSNDAMWPLIFRSSNRTGGSGRGSHCWCSVSWLALKRRLGSKDRMISHCSAFYCARQHVSGFEAGLARCPVCLAYFRRGELRLAFIRLVALPQVSCV